MAEDALAQALRDGLWVSLQVMGPPLLALLAVGLVVSVLQALTQVQEATLSFLPKLVVGGAMMLLFGPFTVTIMRAYAERVFERMVAIGGAG
jgi:flagellar biosynthetic protein FliQ